VSISPTARSLVRLRQLGFLADVCERWLPAVGRKRDLFGVADIVAVHPRDQIVLLVQATTAAHVPDRLRRVQTRPELAVLLAAGVAVEVWGWAQQSGRWNLRKVAVRREDLIGVEVQTPTPRRQRKGHRQRTLFDSQGKE
jgi:hypothetical protein